MVKSEQILTECGVEEGSSLTCFIPMLGGGVITNTNMEPAFIALC